MPAGGRCSARSLSADGAGHSRRISSRLHHFPGRFHHHELHQGCGVETLPTAIFGAVKQGIKPNIMALSTIMLLLSLVLVSVSYLLGRIGLDQGRSRPDKDG